MKHRDEFNIIDIEKISLKEGEILVIKMDLSEMSQLGISRLSEYMDKLRKQSNLANRLLVVDKTSDVFIAADDGAFKKEGMN